MQLFWNTLSFLTILPTPQSKTLPQKEFTKGILFYTLIGLLIGLIDYICYGTIVFLLKMPLSIGAVFAVLSETIITGGFHLDGLADTCDGFFSTRKKEEIIEIMKDSRIGTNGTLALLFDIILKITFLTAIKNDRHFAILLAPVAGKMATPILMKSNYAKEQSGLGNLYLTQKYTKYMIAAILIGIAILVGFLQMKSILPIITVLLFAFLFREYCQQKIGGMTGDTLGAGYEFLEIIFLAVMVLQGGIL